MSNRGTTAEMSFDRNWKETFHFTKRVNAGHKQCKDGGKDRGEDDDPSMMYPFIGIHFDHGYDSLEENRGKHCCNKIISLRNCTVQESRA